MKTHVVFGFILILLLAAGLVSAEPGFASGEKAAEKMEKFQFKLPDYAQEVAPNVYGLGYAVADGKFVEGFAIIHYKDVNSKQSSSSKTSSASCYGFLATGAKWKTIEPYMVDSANTRNLDPLLVKSNLAADVQKWETAAGKNIIGDEIAGAVDGADSVSPDGKNEVLFGGIDSPGAIAVTIVWGYFAGSPLQRELLEWDQIYDQVDYDWSASGEAGKMDFENIATHELGHSVGLADIYNSACTEQTMYGYADYGETKKRTLESGDIIGIKKLYK